MHPVFVTLPIGTSLEAAVTTVRDVLDTKMRRADYNAPVRPLFVDVDCIQIPVPDIEAALEFYGGALGQALIWRTPTAAGLQLADSPTELVLQTERPELEPNLSVASADAAAERFAGAGGKVVVPPFDIPIGRCAVLQDPWGNRLLVLDHRNGRLLIDADGNVAVDAAGRPQTQVT